MAKLRDTLGDAEQQHFTQLTGYHPHDVGVRTHRDAIRYLAYVDLFRKKRPATGKPKPTGLLGLAMSPLA